MDVIPLLTLKTCLIAQPEFISTLGAGTDLTARAHTNTKARPTHTHESNIPCSPSLLAGLLAAAAATKLEHVLAGRALSTVWGLAHLDGSMEHIEESVLSIHYSVLRAAVLGVSGKNSGYSCLASFPHLHVPAYMAITGGRN